MCRVYQEPDWKDRGVMAGEKVGLKLFGIVKGTGALFRANCVSGTLWIP